MDSNRPEGFLRDLAGRVQEALGGLSGDDATRARGRANQAVGQAQHAYGEVLDVVERVATSRPLLTAAAAAGVGFILGMLAARR